jgi:hypothetical protein
LAWAPKEGAVPSSQTTVELGSKPFGLVLAGSSTSGVVWSLPVGRIHRSISMVTLPSALGITDPLVPGSKVWIVSPSQSFCDVGSRLHSSHFSGWPALKVVFAGTVTVTTPASPS